MTKVLGEPTGRTRRAVDVVDCDVHPTAEADGRLDPYLSARWQRHHKLFGGNTYHGGKFPRDVPNAARVDAWPPSGGPPGSDLAFMRLQLLDMWNITHVILGPLVRNVQSGQRNLDYAAAICSAVNDWQAAEWLDQDPRLRGSIAIPYEDADLAVAEIDRLAHDRRFVQVYMQIRTSQPLGQRKYWRLYEAAVRHQLPVGIHFGGQGGNAITGAGWPSYYLEDHAGNAQTFQSQVISLVCEGVFERFPDLKVVLIEGGVAWLPPLAWRLDRAFERLGDEVPMVRRKPSEYIADHFWLTTQPIEEPPDPRSLGRLIEMFPSLRDKLMYSSDYPHWDFDSPDEVLRKVGLSTEVERKIMAENARKLYQL